jgi:hypothetical protein
MTNNILNNFLSDKPTLLYYADELRLMEIMQTLSNDWIINNTNEFMSALDQLWDSHTDGGYTHQPEEDDYIFENFSDWLVKLNRDINISNLKYVGELRSDWVSDFRKKYQKLT